MAQLLHLDAPVSPLLLSDRLIALAEQAQLVGCTATASRLVRLASTVLDEKSGFAPPARHRAPRASRRAR